MTLPRALLLSIVLHAIVLGMARPQQALLQNGSRPPLVARLVEARVASVPAETSTPAKPPRVLRRPTQSTQPSLPIEPVAELAVAEPPAAQEAATVEHSALPSFDPGAIARYRFEIISAARQFKRYPPIARDNGWQGRAEVRVSFDGTRQPALAISRSSGYSVLDRQAVETLSSALAPLPAMLLGRSFELEFPVVFSLED